MIKCSNMAGSIDKTVAAPPQTCKFGIFSSIRCEAHRYSVTDFRLRKAGAIIAVRKQLVELASQFPFISIGWLRSGRHV